MRRLLLLVLVALAFGRDARADWAGGAMTEVPLDGNGSSWFVHATINGTQRGLFLVDTGASLCVLAPEMARRLSLPPSGTQVELHTANGVVKAPVVRLSSVDVGGNRARDVQAVVHAAVAPPLDGIIGLSFLNEFSYAVDPRRRVLRLR
jgi:aspartyl protease family protein